jgi:hypothetical protein
MSQKAAWLNYELGVTRKHSKPYRMGVTKEVAGLTKKNRNEKSPKTGLFSEIGSRTNRKITSMIMPTSVCCLT